ncbi:hypothetical protein RU86_GL001073 [Lactococcus piscium]|uniref:Uncharacterized protein n=1 Tax=Pseudolactococcus piscium TaxID=1364 RepID=A0A2A5S5B0_9LACT|nr:hypothetical protein RU86_GL001073 [Lactococcus piscium]
MTLLAKPLRHYAKHGMKTEVDDQNRCYPLLYLTKAKA